MFSQRKLIFFGSYFDIKKNESKLLYLEKLIDSGNYSMEILKEKSGISKVLSKFSALKNELNEIEELLEITEEENIDDLKDLRKSVNAFRDNLQESKIEVMFKEEIDKAGAFIEINSGAGGTESQDWAHTLERVYVRWALRKGFKTEIIYNLPGDEAGIKTSLIKVEGENVYGWLRFETGVHRLVRISPFNAQGKRQTSFCSLLVFPIVENITKIIINPADLKIDTYKSGGAGGQHVNTTDSAVRITHIPTGIIVACQSGRSQFKNKDEAMKMLHSRLYEMEERKKRERKDSIQKDDISWGNQIRNYVLNPYKLVKDTRTGYETSHTDKILNGEIDEFLVDCLLKLKNKDDS